MLLHLLIECKSVVSTPVSQRVYSLQSMCTQLSVKLKGRKVFICKTIHIKGSNPKYYIYVTM